MISPEARKTLARNKAARDKGMRDAIFRNFKKEDMTEEQIEAERMAKLDKNILAGLRGKRRLPINWKMFSLLESPFAMTDINRSVDKDDATLAKGERSMHNNGVRRRYAKVKAAEDMRAEGIRRRSAGFHVGGNRKLRAEDRRTNSPGR
jgi:hypothetical protein